MRNVVVTGSHKNHCGTVLNLQVAMHILFDTRNIAHGRRDSDIRISVCLSIKPT